MRKLIVSEFLTLDGVMQGPGDVNEDRSGGFDQGGWQPSYFDDVMLSAVSEGIAGAGAYLLGRRTYEIFAAFWPNQPPDDPFAKTLNGLPKYVVSTTLSEPLAWEGSTLVRGDVPAEVAKLKDQPGGDISVLGSGELVQTLVRDGLVDEFSLMIHPIVLGSGKRLFGGGFAGVRLDLVDAKTTTTGVQILTYRPSREAVGPGKTSEVAGAASTRA